MSEKLPPRVKQTAVDHRLAVESGSAGWDQPGGKPYKQSPTPKVGKPAAPTGDTMDPMFMAPPAYKKPARVRSENPEKKRKLKVPKQPPDVNQVLMDLINLPVVGDDVWDILMVEPLTVGDRKSSKKAAPKPAKKKQKQSKASQPSIRNIAADFLAATSLDDVAMDEPPPFRGY